MRQITLNDLQRKEREPTPHEWMHEWLKHPAPWSAPETLWPELLTSLKVQDGAAILELAGGRSSLIASVGGGVFYQWVDTDRGLAKIQKGVFAEGAFAVMTPEALTQGEPTPGWSLVVVHLGTVTTMHPGPCFEPMDYPAQEDAWLQAGVKSVGDQGYLVVVGNLRPSRSDYIASKLAVVFAGPLEGVQVLIAQKVQRANAVTEIGQLPACPIRPDDPRPFVITPWSIKLKSTRPHKAMVTQLVRKGDKLGVAFDNHRSAEAWAGGVLTAHQDPAWFDAEAKAVAKLEVFNYLRLRQEGQTLAQVLGMPETWPVQEEPSLSRWLAKLNRRLARDLTSYPRNNDPARAYWSLGIGDVVHQNGVAMTVTNVDISLNDPPKITLEGQL